MDKYPRPNGQLKLVLNPQEQRALAASLVHVLGSVGELPPDPVIQHQAGRLASVGPEPNYKVTIDNFCPNWANPLSSALGTYALHARNITNLVADEVRHPEMSSFVELGPIAENLAGEMAAIALG